MDEQKSTFQSSATNSASTIELKRLSMEYNISRKMAKYQKQTDRLVITIGEVMHAPRLVVPQRIQEYE
jgi:hypothetical protein